MKIEKNSINKLKEIIGYHSLMNDFINDNDKEPSWDGTIIPLLLVREEDGKINVVNWIAKEGYAHLLKGRQERNIGFLKAWFLVEIFGKNRIILTISVSDL